MANMLQAEDRKLEVLKQSREQIQQLTDASKEVLEKLERRLQRLYQTLKPIREDTHTIATAEKNIDASLVEVQKVMSYHSLAQERLEDVRLRVTGSSTDPEKNPFLRWVNDINEAVRYFRLYKFRNSERLLKKFKEISRIALEKMEVELSNQLNDYSRDSLKTLHDQRHYLRQQHDILNPLELLCVQDLAMELIKPERLRYMAHMCRVLEKTSTTNGLENETKYAIAVWKSRREALLITLKNFRGIHADRLLLTEGDSMRITACDPSGDERSENRAAFFFKFLIVFFQLVQVERSLLEAIFSETTSEKAKFSRSFNQMLEEPILFLAQFMTEHIVDKKSYDEEPRVITLLKVIERWKQESGRFAGVLYFQDIPREKASWLEIEALLSQCEKCVLEDFVERLKLLSEFGAEKSSKKKKEISGGYHRMTIETTNLLVDIYSFRDTVDIICKKHSDSQFKDTVQLIHSIQGKLLDAMKSKAKSFKHGPLRCLFLLNNIQYVIHKYQNTELEGIASQFVENCKREIVHQRNQYQTTWLEMKNLLNLEGAPLYPRPKPNDVKIEKKDLSRNDIQQIKHRCRSFYTKFDDELTKQRNYHVPDATLRHQLRAENVDWMVNDYEIFFNHYRYIEFTSESSKYLKWDPKSFEKMIEAFFEVSS